MSAGAVLKLQAVGFSQPQVEALAEFMDTQAASKLDLETVGHDLKSEIAGVQHQLKSEIAGVQHQLQTEIAAVRHRIDEVEHRLEAKISDGKVDVIKWVIGMGFAQAGLVLAVARVLTH